MGSQSSSGTTRIEPPSYQLPYLQNGLQQAQNLYNQGSPQQYGGQTVAGFAPQQEQAMQMIENRATAGSPLVSGASQFVQNTLNTPASSSFGNAQNPYSGNVVGAMGSNPYASNAVGQIGSNPYAANAVSQMANNPYASNAVSQIGSNPYANNALGGVMNSNPYGSTNNPYLDATFQKAADQSQNRLASEYARAGRNTGASAAVRADQLNNLATQIYMPAFESERNRGLQYGQQQLGLYGQGALQGQNIGAQTFGQNASQQAQGQLAGQSIGAQSFGQNAAQQAQGQLAGQNIGAQTFGQNAAQQAQGQLAGQSIGAQSFGQNASQQAQGQLAGQSIGAQGYENAQQRALQDLMSQRGNQFSALSSVLPLANQDYVDYGQLAGVGQQVQGLSNQIMQDRANRFNYEQAAPGTALDQYLARVRGTDYGSTQTTQQRQPSNLLGSLLGGGLMLGGLL